MDSEAKETERQKGERGALLTSKQYDLIVRVHKTGAIPTQQELEEAGINDSKQTCNSSRAGKFKSWARRMYLRSSDDTLIHRITGKIIIPQEKFESVILGIHRGKDKNSNHLGVSETLAKVVKTYTYGKRSFGMNEEIIKSVVKSCTTGSCGKRRNGTRKHLKKIRPLSGLKDLSEEIWPKEDQLSKSSLHEPTIFRKKVKPKKLIPKTPSSNKTATSTRSVDMAPLSSVSSLNPSYQMVYSNIFNQCLTSTNTKNQGPVMNGSPLTGSTTFIPHAAVPPNFIGVPKNSLQCASGLTSNMYLLPHSQGADFMSLLQAAFPQTQQFNIGNGFGHQVSSNEVKPYNQVSNTSGSVTSAVTQEHQHFNGPSINVKTPELAKMLKSPVLSKTASNSDRSSITMPPPPPLKGPLKDLELMVNSVQCGSDNSTSIPHTTSDSNSDKKTITICVFPFPASTETSTTAENSPIGQLNEVSQPVATSSETTQHITIPIVSLPNSKVQKNTALLAEKKESPDIVNTKPSLSTKKKLKAKLCSLKQEWKDRQLALANVKNKSLSRRKDGNSFQLFQNSDLQKSAKTYKIANTSHKYGKHGNKKPVNKLDRARLLCLLKKGKIDETKMTIRQLKRNTLPNQLNSHYLKGKGFAIKDHQRCQKTIPATVIPDHSGLDSEATIQDDCEEWDRKCLSVLGEKVTLPSPEKNGALETEEIKEHEDDQQLPFIDSEPLPLPHIWHNYEDIIAEQNCFHRLLPVFRDMKLDIMKSILRDHNATERLKKKISYGESLIQKYRDFMNDPEDQAQKA